MATSTRAQGVETRGDRVALAQHAGMGRLSLASVLAGTLVAYGAFAVLLAITAAVAESVGIDTDLSTNEWRELGAAGGAAVAAVLLACYLFGGYVAGRMARRAGAANGVGVFVLGVLVAVGVTGLVNVFTDGDDILRNLRNVGVPTSGEEWRDVGTVAGIGSLLAMFAGAVMGGVLGERWHAKLVARAVDPDVGAEADARRQAEEARLVANGRHAESEQRVAAANPSREGAYTDGTRPAYGPTTAVSTADRPAGPDLARRRTADDDNTVVDSNRRDDGGRDANGRETPWRQFTPGPDSRSDRSARARRSQDADAGR